MKRRVGVGLATAGLLGLAAWGVLGAAAPPHSAAVSAGILRPAYRRATAFPCGPVAGLDYNVALVDATGAALATTANPLKVNVGSGSTLVSTANSSTATLLANAVFTGTGEDVSSYTSITVAVFTDQVSAGSGVSLQWSSDNTNWDVKETHSVTSFTVSGGSAPGAAWTVPPKEKFFRVVYTNGGVGQTLFRLQTIYHGLPVVSSTASGTGAAPSAQLSVCWDSVNDIYNPVRSASSQADATSGGTIPVAAPFVYNGATFDKQRAVAAATGTTGTGILGTGPLLWDLVGTTNFVKQAGDGSGRAIVVGAGANQSAVAGNPHWIAGSTTAAGGNLQGLVVESAAQPNLRTGIYNGSSQSGVAGPGDTTSAPVGLEVYGFPMAYNGATFDRIRSNVDVVVQASTATTVQTINTDITNYNGRSFMVHANVTNYNAGSILMKLQWKDANGLFVDIPGATTGAVTSGADLILAVGPTVWPANTATAFYVNYFVPRLVRLVTTIATATVTFSESYELPAN